MRILAATKDMTRDDWLAHRVAGIGSSDAAAVLGVDRYRSRPSVYLEKTGQTQPDPAGEAAYWGTVLEDVVAREFARRTGLRTRRSNAILQHDAHDHMLANIDRRIIPDGETETTPGILECKTTSAWLGGAWRGDVPDYVYCQVMHQLAVTGWDYAYVAVLIGGQRYEHVRIARDEEFIEALVAAETRFWVEHVQVGIPPDVDDSEDCAEALARMYPGGGDAIDLPDDADDILAALDAMRHLQADAEQRVTGLQNRIKAMLGDAHAGVRGHWQVTWKPATYARLDTKRLKAEKPDVYEAYVKESTSRRFSVKEAK